MRRTVERIGRTTETLPPTVHEERNLNDYETRAPSSCAEKDK